MKSTTATIHEMTLGDLVAAAFDQAERTSGLPLVAGQVAAREIERSLTRANRLDLIRTLAVMDQELRVAAPSSARRPVTTSAFRSSRQDRPVAIAAAG
jgi:hypothetical protein